MKEKEKFLKLELDNFYTNDNGMTYWQPNKTFVYYSSQQLIWLAEELELRNSITKEHINKLFELLKNEKSENS